MAWTTPKTWSVGEVLTAANLNAQLRDNLNAAFPLGAPDVAWTSFTPTLTQSGAVTKTVTYARYTRIGRLIIAQVELAVTGSGTTGIAILAGPPVTPIHFGNHALVGNFWVYDASAGVVRNGVARMATNATIDGLLDNTAGGIGQNPSFALASGDLVSYNIQYEAA